MQKFNKIHLTIIILVLLGTVAIRCNRTSTEPAINIEQEAALVPWQKITGKIAYSRTRVEDELTGYLFVIDGNSKKISLVKKSVGVDFANLVWSIDGTKITYSDFDINALDLQLYNINIDGSNQSIIYSVDAHNNYPAWSQDGRLAYWYNGMLYPQGNSAIWIDGKPFFWKAFCNQTRPAWSPDSRFLVISIQDTTSHGALYRVSLADTLMTPLKVGIGFDSLRSSRESYYCPIYSPDGSKIAFVNRVVGSDYEIWIINANGSNPTRLTSGFFDNYPAWSPDGSKIAFERRENIFGKIFLMNSDGSEITQVTQNEGHYPAWVR